MAFPVADFIELVRVAAKLARPEKPVNTQAGMVEWLNGVLDAADIVSGWTQTAADDKAIAFIRGLVQNDALFGIVWPYLEKALEWAKVPTFGVSDTASADEHLAAALNPEGVEGLKLATAGFDWAQIAEGIRMIVQLLLTLKPWEFFKAEPTPDA